MDEKQVIKYMLQHGKTMEQLKTEKPKVYSHLFPDDNTDTFIHTLAERNNSFYKTPKEAQEATMRQVKQLGYDMRELNNRASTYNRFSNGTALTVAQGMSGVNNFLQWVGFEGDPLISEQVDLLKAQAEKDSKLYSSTEERGNMFETDAYKAKTIAENTPATDIATTAGKSAPMAAAAIALPATRLGSLADIGISSAVLNGTKDATTSDYIAAVLSPLAGLALANKLSSQTGKAYRNAKEYSDAIKAEPALARDLAKMAKEKNLDLKDLSIHGDVSFKDTALPKTKQEMKAWRAEALKTAKDERVVGQQQILDFDAANPRSADDVLGTEQHRKLGAALDEKDMQEIAQRLPVSIARKSQTPDEFLKSVIESEEALIEAGYGTLVKYAKNANKLSSSDRKNFLINSGLNGLLALSGNPGTARFMPEAWKRWLGSMAKQTANSAKETMTKPRGEGISNLLDEVAGSTTVVDKAVNDMIDKTTKSIKKSVGKVAGKVADKAVNKAEAADKAVGKAMDKSAQKIVEETAEVVRKMVF